MILAVPVAPPGWVDRLAGAADELVSAHVAQDFTSVGQFYEDFTQTTDEQVSACLLDQAGGAGDVACSSIRLGTIEYDRSRWGAVALA